MLAFFLPVVAFLRMDRSRENTLIMLLISDPDMQTVIRDSLASQGNHYAFTLSACVGDRMMSKVWFLQARAAVQILPFTETLAK